MFKFLSVPAIFAVSVGLYAGSEPDTNKTSFRH